MEQEAEIRSTIVSHMRIGLAVLAFLIFGLGGWAATTELSGAVVSPGVVVVDTNVKKIQHLTGGIVRKIHVREGSVVHVGDLVVQLDDTVARSNLAIIAKTLDELDARQARLKAERDEQTIVIFPDNLLSRADNSAVSDIIQEERKLFNIRSVARSGQKAQLKERVGQLNEELQGILTQAAAKGREIELVNQELEGVRQLWNKKLIPITRLMILEREAVRIEGERGQLLASSAQIKGKITETGLQILQIDQDLRSEVAKELRDIQAKSAELIERKVAAEDQLKHIDIRAPQDGVVHQLGVHTIGGVIGPGEQIMLIVPQADELIVEIKIPPQNIDQVTIGQSTVLRFSAFNQRTTPELIGRVVTVGADVTQDPKTGVSYFLARVTIAPDETAKLEGLKLLPGMPVEAFVQTHDRSVMSFLMKPLADQVTRAFRER